MSERIQKVLDGELPRDRLGPVERAELDAYEEAVDAALAGLRAEGEPDVAGPVMRRVAELPELAPERESALRRWWSVVWRPRSLTLTLRPAYGVAVAALVAAVWLVPGPLDRPGTETAETSPGPRGAAVAAAPAAAPSGDGAVLVHFRLEAPDARRVALAGDFTGWQPRHSLHQVRDGVWTVVVPVQPGVHQYGFLIDGERWRVDPFAPQVEDGFGGVNSRLDVLAPVQRPL